MVYRCVHCSEIYPDGAQETINGCGRCSSKFFFYIKEDKLKQIIEQGKQAELEPKLTISEKKQIESDVREIIGLGEKDEETPVFLDFESVKVMKPGKYLLDLQKLFSIDKPRVYQMENGKYIVDLVKNFKSVNSKKQ